MELITQIIIALITTSLGSILAYFKSIRETNSKIEQLKINSDSEIKKIREESRKELDRIRAESEEKIKEKLIENELNLKNKEENLKYDVMGQFIQEILKDPKKGVETLKGLEELTKIIPKKED